MVGEINNKIRGNTEGKRTIHPNSLKNLKPAKAGEVRNPNGRPKKDICIVSRQKEMLSEICPFDAQHRTWRDALAEAEMRLALSKPEAMRDLMDRLEGKITQPIAPVGENGAIATFMLVMPDGDKRTAKELAETG